MFNNFLKLPLEHPVKMSISFAFVYFCDFEVLVFCYVSSTWQFIFGEDRKTIRTLIHKKPSFIGYLCGKSKYLPRRNGATQKAILTN